MGRAGDIVAIAGVEGITIGETVTSAERRAHLPAFPSTSRPFPWLYYQHFPFSGREGNTSLPVTCARAG
jgi:GTP-binding protein